jgi:hypothetical protein
MCLTAVLQSSLSEVAIKTASASASVSGTGCRNVEENKMCSPDRKYSFAVRTVECNLGLSFLSPPGRSAEP